MNKILFTFSLLCIAAAHSCSLFGNETDSLRNELGNSSIDTNRVLTLVKLARQFYNVNNDTVIFYYDQALETSRQLPAEKERFISYCYHKYGYFQYKYGNFDSALVYYDRAIKASENCMSGEESRDNAAKTKIADICMNAGTALASSGMYDRALKYLDKAWTLYEGLDLKENATNALTNIATVYYKKGESDKAIRFFQQSLAIYEELGNQRSVGTCYENIGLVHLNQDNFEQAQEYYQKALEIFLSLGDNSRICFNCMNLGTILYYQGKFDQAMTHYQRSMVISEEQNDKRGMARSYENVGVVHEKRGNYMEAMKFYQQAADTYRDNDDLSGESHVFVNIAQLSNLMARDAATGLEKEAGYRRAVKYAERAMTVAAETGELPMVNLACAKLSTAWAGLGDYKKAWEYAVRQIETGDSLYNAEKIKAVQEMESRYQSEKKQLQIENLEKDKVLQETKIEAQASDMKRQRIMIYSFIVVLSVILIFSFLLYRMFLAKKKANIELALKNHQIMQQKEEIEAQRDQLATQNDEIRKQKDEIESHIELIEKQRDTVTKQRDQIEHINTEITDSIHYAKRIQGAILPRDAYARDLLKDYFVLFRPKDIVSGDFYWMTKIEGRTVVAAADCTGHGVPGAFMSMLGAAFLNEIVNKEYITHTGVILRRLRKEIIKALQQKGQTGEQKDGMDISLCSIDMESLDFQFSGANNPLYIIRDKNAPELSGWEGFEGDSCILYEIKGDKMPIAIYERMDKFVDHELQLVKGDRLYLFTDGFADQFGGPKGKKFKYKPFKQLLLDNALNPMQEQKAVLEKSLQEWIVCDGTEYEQVDDITVVGIEI